MSDLNHPPENPIELRDDEERHEDGSEQAADRRRNEAKGDDRQRERFGEGDQDQHRPVDQIRQNRPRIRLQKVRRQIVEVLIDVVEGARFEHALKVEG
ncbi:MAG TPA: hypothetical protein VGL53_00895, partial [Bryobacteraceae bacterium]